MTESCGFFNTPLFQINTYNQFFKTPKQADLVTNLRLVVGFQLFKNWLCLKIKILTIFVVCFLFTKISFLFKMYFKTI